MTGKQARFADEYLVDQNATQAAIRAGYSKNTAYSQGGRLLKNVEIRAYIDKQLASIHNDNIADAEEVMRYLTSVVRGESESEVVVIEATGDGLSEARNIKKAPDEKDKLKAAELLGKRYGLYSEKVNLTGTGTVMIVDDCDQ